MNTFQIKAARALAQSEADLSAYDYDCLYGCACPEFKPVLVSLGAVARLMRWQYLCFDGSWDERLWNEELWVYRKRIQVVDMDSREVRAFVRDSAAAVLSR